MPIGTVRGVPDRRPRTVRSTFGAPVGILAEIIRRASGLTRRRNRPATRFRRSSRGREGRLADIERCLVVSRGYGYKTPGSWTDGWAQIDDLDDVLTVARDAR